MKEFLLLISTLWVIPILGQVDAEQNQEASKFELTWSHGINHTWLQRESKDDFLVPRIGTDGGLLFSIADGDLKINTGIVFRILNFSSGEYNKIVRGSPGGGFNVYPIPSENLYNIRELIIPIGLEYINTNKISLYVSAGVNITAISAIKATVYYLDSSGKRKVPGSVVPSVIRGPLFSGILRSGVYVPLKKNGLIASVGIERKTRFNNLQGYGEELFTPTIFSLTLGYRITSF
jgi:hypothetical protein